MPKKSTKPVLRGLKTVYLLGFLLSISTALPAYIHSNFIEQFTDLANVSWFFLAANLLTFLCIIIYPSFIKNFKNYQTAKLAIAFNLMALVGLATVNSWFPLLMFFVVLLTANTLLWINLDIFLEKFITTKKTGRIRTTFYTLMNLGWVITPLFVSYLSKNGTYHVVYLVSALIMLPFYIIFWERSRYLKDHFHYKRLEIIKSIKKIIKNHNLQGIFSVSIFLNLFYALAVVYMPIYLHNNLGFAWSQLGVMFSIMLLPFILFEWPAGYLADKYLGEKEIMITGLFILIISLVLFATVTSSSMLVWTIILFFSRIGAALVEAMRESYFFKRVRPKDIDIIDFFRTTTPLGYILGTIIGGLCLSVMPINYMFLVLATILLLGFYFIFILKDTK